MSRTIEAIIEKLEPVKRRSIPTHAKRLTANWQNGLESGSHVQRKIRLAFANVAAHPQVN
ncbi:MAG: hypothetical protein DME85_13450 [Verrucomicrobia bacterium]|nr:MAG: hypothetical protein DME85_13450 [Verrucomicrobiota bacterium]